MPETELKEKNHISKKQKITLIVCLSILIALIVGVVLVDAFLPNRSVDISMVDSTSTSQ